MNRSIEIADFTAVQIEKLRTEKAACYKEAKRLQRKEAEYYAQAETLRRLGEDVLIRLNELDATLRYFLTLQDPLSSSSLSSSDESQPPPAAPPNTQEDE